MEKLCNKIAEKIAIELNFDRNKKEVIAYGMFALFQMILSIVLVALFGVLFNVLIKALIISFTVSILRKYSGGAHASSSISCIFLGTLICIGQAILVKFLGNQQVALNFMILSGAIIFAWSYFIVYKFAPVDSPAKPIKNKDKRQRMRKGSIIILSAYVVIVIINLVMYYFIRNSIVINYCLSIYIGVLWQVLTITTYGNTFVTKLELLFNHILKF
ncbi:accessory gene regulator B [Clostridium punense]|uniref:Accessory gene regulator B n=1 Tax=Clostridium punense TaxID=1054297 RepID=A0ABS4K786_9CLOT|nr:MULTISPECIES: accessory gene regulator B family protein [Clostridium]EQB88605.1 hypothetical protein M918_24010 [Clostridium sp. BL8]MBP2023654.1 accessory gene regulator B [Clostridium punense]